MSLFKKLFGKKSKSAIFSDQDLIDANACPNCWGHELYDGKFTQYVKDQTKANINHDSLQKKAFIQQFVETNVSGIKLKQEGNHRVCLRCKGKY